MWYGRDDDAFERKPVTLGEVDFEPHLDETCDEYDVRIAHELQVYNGRPAIQYEAERADRREKGK